MAMVTGGRIGEVRPRFGDQTAHSDQSKPISLSWLVDGLLRRRGMALAVWPEGVQVAKESLLGSACKIVLRVGLRRNWRAIHSAGRWMIRRVGLVWLLGERPRVLSPAGHGGEEEAAEQAGDHTQLPCHELRDGNFTRGCRYPT